MLKAMPGRLITYVVPIAAVLITVLVLLGPGSARPALSVRVFGLPVTGGTTLALRIAGTSRLHGAEISAPLDDVLVEAYDGATALAPARGPLLPPYGVGEVVLHASAPLSGPLMLRVRHGEHVLAEGPVPLRPPKPLQRRSGEIRGTTSGALSAMRVFATRGQLAAPFEDALRIEIPGAADVTIEGSAPGAEITPDRVTTDARGTAFLRVKPLAHLVELALSARAPDGRAGRWEGLLPVKAGATWLDRSRMPEALVLVSPAPHDRVYVSFLADEGRIFGAIVPLVRDPEGFFRGELALTVPAARRAAAIVVSDDTRELAAGTVAWPLEPPEGAVEPPELDLLLDGLPDAFLREAERAARARRAALQVVGASALFEILLLFLRSRRAQRKLDDGLADAAGAQGEPGSGLEVPVAEADRKQILAAAREHPALRVALAVALVLLAFAVVAAMATFR
jgi:hypothetical protein